MIKMISSYGECVFAVCCTLWVSDYLIAWGKLAVKLWRARGKR